MINFKVLLALVAVVCLNSGTSAEQLYLASPLPSGSYPQIDTKNILLSLPPLQVSPLRVKAKPSESTLFFIKRNEKKEDEFIPVGVNDNYNTEPLKFFLTRVTVPRIISERNYFDDISNDMVKTINNFKDSSVVYSNSKFDTNSIVLPYVKNTPLVFGSKAQRFLDSTPEQNFGSNLTPNLAFNSKPSFRPISVQSFVSPQSPKIPFSNKQPYYKSQQLTFGTFSDTSNTEQLIKAKIDAFFANTDKTSLKQFDQQFETRLKLVPTTTTTTAAAEAATPSPSPPPTTTTPKAIITLIPTTTTTKPVTTEASKASSKLSDTAILSAIPDALESKQTIKKEIESIKRGSIRGSYSYVDNKGITRKVNYIADENGFRSNIDAKDNGSFNADTVAVTPLEKETTDSILSNFSSQNNGTIAS